MKKFAIVYPVYNTADYLEESLNSILNQTYSHFEIFCVDDGSTDNSLEILKTYQSHDSRIHVMTQGNKGQSAARNRALSTIRNGDKKFDYVLFIDSDDKISPDFLQKCSTENENADLIVTSIARFNNKGLVNDHRPTVQEQLIDQKEFCLHYFKLQSWSNSSTTNFLGVANKCFKLSVIQEAVFDTSLRLAEDQDFILKVLMKLRTIKLLPSIYYYYRQRESSVTHTYQYEGFSDNFYLYKKYLSNSEATEEIRQGIQSFYLKNLWSDVRAILLSQLPLASKKLCFKEAVEAINREFEFPLTTRERKHRCQLNKGFFLNLLISKFRR